MQREKAVDASAGLSGLRAKIADWRRLRPRTRPMPESLWSEASRAARRLGIWRVARELKVNYMALKKRTARSAPTRRGAQPSKRREVASAAPQFIELSGLGRQESVVREETVMDLVASDGTRMTIRLKGANPDVAGLLNAFRSRV